MMGAAVPANSALKAVGDSVGDFLQHNFGPAILRPTVRLQRPVADLVFTDLDGTLLDHDTYSWEAARPALSRLRHLGIPLVLCSSKTAAELRPIAKRLGLQTPLIVENGGGIRLPRHFLDRPAADARSDAGEYV